eukprot:4210148-Pleurochrysis_carterae.AAC.1
MSPFRRKSTCGGRARKVKAGAVSKCQRRQGASEARLPGKRRGEGEPTAGSAARSSPTRPSAAASPRRAPTPENGRKAVGKCQRER